VNTAAFNRHLETGRVRAEEHLAALERGYRLTLRAAGRHAADRFSALATDHLTAAVDPKWSPPEESQLLNGETMQQDARKRTLAARKNTLKAVMAPALAEVGVGFDLTNPLIAGLVDGLGARTTDLGDAISAQIAQAVADSYQQGLSIPNTAAAIRAAVDGISDVRATMLARTEMISLVNGGSIAAARLVNGAADGGEPQVGYKRWLATEDERTRETHAEADGQVVAIDQPFQVGGEQADFPGDPGLSDEEAINCFPMDTKVEFPGLRAVMRRRYEGDLVRIRLSSGNELAGTPNHPVLRSDGEWVALGDLQEGEYLVCASGVGQAPGTPDPDRPPSEIGEVYRLASAGAEPHRIRLAPPDLHGNGAHGEVDVVAVDGSLLIDSEAATDEQVTEFGFAVADYARAGERICDTQIGGSHARAATLPSGGIRGKRELSPFRIRESAHAEQVRFGAGSDRKPQLLEPTRDDLPARSERLAYGEHAFPALVSLAQITKVERHAFHGDVGDIDTGHGWYTSEGVIVKNCRCTVTYLEAAEAVSETEDMALAAASAPEVSNLAMVAVYPRFEEAQTLATPEGQDAGSLHVTLLFLGEADALDAPRAHQVAGSVAQSLPPLDGTVGGVASFGETPDGYPAIVLPDVQGLSTLQEAVRSALADAGIESPSEHGFLPHMTLDYADTATPPDEEAIGAPLHFDALSVVVGGKRTDYQLAASTESPTDAVASGGHMAESPQDTLTADVTVTVGDSTAAEQADDAAQVRWQAVLCVEGEPTEDGRMLEAGSITWRDLPLSLGVMFETPHSFEASAEIGGRIDRIWRDGNLIRGEGVFTQDDVGRRAACCSSSPRV
jgi:2'-5' RNA ligase